MASAMKALANITLTGSATSVTFSSIAAGYKDYVVVCGKMGDSINVELNADSGANYHYNIMYGNGSTASATKVSPDTFIGGYWLSSNENALVQIIDATSTDKHKSVLIRSNQASSATTMVVGRWANTAAVTSIKILAGSSFTAGATFALYGVLA